MEFRKGANNRVSSRNLISVFRLKMKMSDVINFNENWKKILKKKE